MLKKIGFYSKIGYKILKKDVIGREDYREDYDRLAGTYGNWLNKMGQFTDKIIKLDHSPHNQKLKILDLACGTGYISKKLLEKDIDFELTAVDHSDKMLEGLRMVKDSRLKTIHSDGIEFLQRTKERFDIIYFGWALSYFDYRELFQLFKKVLNPGGIVATITNVQGTLAGIEEIFLKVMYENPREVIRPMDIRFNLPKGKEGLVRWFSQYGFQSLEVAGGEAVFVFDGAGEILEWLNETGALAGTRSIFKDYNLVKDSLIEGIKEKRYKNGKYEINHRFAYGIFRLK